MHMHIHTYTYPSVYTHTHTQTFSVLCVCLCECLCVFTFVCVCEHACMCGVTRKKERASERAIERNLERQLRFSACTRARIHVYMYTCIHIRKIHVPPFYRATQIPFLGHHALLYLFDEISNMFCAHTPATSR